MKKLLVVALLGVVLTGCGSKEPVKEPEKEPIFASSEQESVDESFNLGVEPATEEELSGTEEQSTETGSQLTIDDVPDVNFAKDMAVLLNFENDVSALQLGRYDGDKVKMLYVYSSYVGDVPEDGSESEDIELGIIITPEANYFVDGDKLYTLKDVNSINLTADFGVDLEYYFDKSDLIAWSVDEDNGTYTVYDSSDDAEYTYGIENNADGYTVNAYKRLSDDVIVYSSVNEIENEEDDVFDASAYEKSDEEVSYIEAITKLRGTFDEYYIKLLGARESVVPDYTTAKDSLYYKAVPTQTDEETGWMYDVFEDGVYVVDNTESSWFIVSGDEIIESEFSDDLMFMDISKSDYEKIAIGVAHRSMRRVK